MVGKKGFFLEIIFDQCLKRLFNAVSVYFLPSFPDGFFLLNNSLIT